MDADVRLRASRIDAPRLPLDDMDAHLLLDAGLLRLEPLNFGVAGGDIRSTIRMDARESVAKSLAARKMLPDPKDRDWTKPQIESLYAHLGEKHVQTLKDWDTALEAMARRVRRGYLPRAKQ